ncbi:hypothetical protein FBY11_1732 [Pseudomonas sp. SJZ124]|nr:hypothetical protein FBY02_1692 [Pseudomonas sp. SJZ078]TWC43921.1 hypothetical protein FBY11_1732 [Pseudomonas sp. SJZ124]
MLCTFTIQGGGEPAPGGDPTIAVGLLPQDLPAPAPRRDLSLLPMTDMPYRMLYFFLACKETVPETDLLRLNMAIFIALARTR